jgi:magnesium chelatase subunit D
MTEPTVLPNIHERVLPEPWQAELAGRLGDGERVLAPSCCRAPADGMKVRTESDMARRARRMVIELLLAECYVRRDQVAVLAFRGVAAELVLPPTRSLVRARRGLAGLPGGGGTPLATGIDAASAVAAQVRRGGSTPVVVLLTDGRANVARDGTGGRARAQEDALAAARALRAQGGSVVLIDTAVRPDPLAQALALAAGARYLALPQANAAALSRALRVSRERP